MARPAKKKAPTAGAIRAQTSTSKRQCIDRSSAVKAQELRIIEALRRRPHTTDDFRKLGIFQISARIWGLRAKGWNIKTDRVTVVDRDSYSHPRAGLYSLHESEGAA